MVRGEDSPISTFMCRSLSAPLTRSAEEHLADPQLDLGEVVDADFAGIGRDTSGRRLCGSRRKDRSLAGFLLDLEFLHLVDRVLHPDAGTRRSPRRLFVRLAIFPNGDPRSEPIRAGSGIPSCSQILRATSGMTG